MAKEPTIGAYIDDEERELVESLENEDDWVSIKTPELVRRYQEAARATLDESTSITIDIRLGDLVALRSRARREGVSEQDLINAILHKAVNE